MKPVIYLDVVLLINLVMNFILLFLSIRVAGKKPVVWRVLLASACASAYAVLVFVPKLWLFYTLFFRILFSLLILWVSARVRSLKELVKLAVVFYITSFVFGGGVLAFFWMLGRAGFHSAVFGNVSVTLDFPYLLFVFAVSACLAMYYLFDQWMKKKAQVKSHVCPAYIELGGKTLVVDTLLDTGCRLRDPVSKKPVFVVEQRLLAGFYPKEVLDFVSRFYECGDAFDSDVFVNHRMQLVPFSALSSGQGMLLCLPADGIVFPDRPEKRYDCLIGIYHQTFQNEYYRAIVGPDVVFEGDLEGYV